MGPHISFIPWKMWIFDQCVLIVTNTIYSKTFKGKNFHVSIVKIIHQKINFVVHACRLVLLIDKVIIHGKDSQLSEKSWKPQKLSPSKGLLCTIWCTWMYPSPLCTFVWRNKILSTTCVHTSIIYNFTTYMKID